MKKLAALILVLGLGLSLGIFCTKNYQYELYKIEPKSTTLKTYHLQVNLASAEDFDTLPGIGPKLAEAIVQYREKHGRFNSPEDLLEVSGLGKKKFAKIKVYLRS